MNIRRLIVLLQKEFLQGPKNFMFVFALVIPVVLSLILSLAFGTLFAGKPRLGIQDAGSSAFTSLAQAEPGLVVKTYLDEGALKTAAENGAVDLAVALPSNFDQAIKRGEQAGVVIYVWGESLLRDRAMIATSVLSLVRAIAGQEPPVEVASVVLGDTHSIPWEQRLLPFVVLMGVVLAGSIVPASLIVDEKYNHTLRALTTSSARLEEVLMAKGLVGVILSIIMGVMVLVINRAFNENTLLLVGILALGAVLAAAFGVLLGLLIKDINSLFTVVKGIGIFLYAPALIYMFPDIPAWIGKLFPTYYIINPVTQVAQGGATWSEIAPDIGVLAGLIVLTIAVVAFMARRTRVKDAAD